MGPIIILDKSSIQSLSAQEIDFLYRYYTINITPVLIIEILGDLMKPDKAGALTGKQVTQLANKLLQINSAINENYKLILIGSLMGNRIKMDGRTHVGKGKLVVEPDGKKGFVFEESLEEQAIHRWRQGRFSDAEAILSHNWRESTGNIKLEPFKQIFKPFASLLPDTKNFEELVSQLDLLLLTPSLQTQALAILLYLFPMDPNIASKIFYRWETGQTQLLRDFAPYAFYCFRVTMAFYLGIVRDYITTRPTNQVDLEYAYYLPFTMVFSSRDNFHKILIPAFLRSDQSFVQGDDLKSDLKTMVDQWISLDSENQAAWLKDNGQYPPQREESITFRLWQKHTKPRSQIMSEVRRQSGKGKVNEIMDRILRLKQEGKPLDGSINADVNDEDIDFIVHERNISVEDPCPCGSGKKAKECHFKQVIDNKSNPK